MGLSDGFYPYQLISGHEAVLPWELKTGSKQLALHNLLTTDDYRNLVMNESEDLVNYRVRALANIEADKLKVAKHYDKKIKPKAFRERDLVWKLILLIGTNDGRFGKWSPNLDGPYRIR